MMYQGVAGVSRYLLRYILIVNLIALKIQTYR